ncbi:MAG: ImmA/IrrE family metallo-endopeptidase [Candidatus Nitrosocaldaceae archaeon]
MERVMLKVKSSVFKWLREDSGYTIKEVARKLDVTPKDIEDWESKSIIKLTYEQIKRLAQLYDVPVTNFFLPHPPPYQPLSFLRRGEIIMVSPKVHKIKRKARYLRSIIYEIDRENIEKIKDRIPHYRIDEDPEECAKQERSKHFNAIELTRTKDSKDKLKKLGKLKKKLAEIGIYVFEFNMPLEEVRGFSLVDELPYIIVINAEDSINGKIFTLLHEYAHILLRDQKGCTEMELADDKKEYRGIERWCNTFAASFLIPTLEIEGPLEVDRVDDLLEALSKRYTMSKYAIAVRILTLKQQEVQQLQSVISKSIDRLKEEAKEGMSRRDEERYLFTWEDVTPEGVKVPDRFAVYLRNILGIEVKELLLCKSNEDRIEIILTQHSNKNKKVGDITIEEDSAILMYKDKEHELDIKRVDNKTNIYRPFVLNKVNLRKNQLGLYFIEKVIDAYNQKMITTADLLDYLQIKTKDLPKILR